MGRAEFFFCILASVAGLDLTFPRDMVDVAGRDAGLSLLVIGAATLVSVVLNVRLAALFPDQGPLDYLPRILGRPLGRTVQLFVWLFYLALAAWALRNIVEVIHTLFLPNTPTSALAIGLVLTVLSIVRHDIGPLARTVQVIMLVSLSVVLAVTLFRLPSLAEAWATVPGPVVHLDRVLQGARDAYYVLVGSQVMLKLYPHVRAHGHRRVRSLALTAVGAQGIALAILFVVTEGSLGPGATTALVWPSVTTLRLVVLQGFFVNRLGLLAMMSWSGLSVSFLLIRVWDAATEITGALGLPRGNYTWTLPLLGAALLWLAFFPRDTYSLTLLAIHLLSPAAILITLVLPALLLLVARMRHLWHPPYGPASAHPPVPGPDVDPAPAS